MSVWGDEVAQPEHRQGWWWWWRKGECRSAGGVGVCAEPGGDTTEDIESDDVFSDISSFLHPKWKGNKLLHL